MNATNQIWVPYSIRFKPEEREYIREIAKKLEMKDAAFIRMRIFDDDFRRKFSKSSRHDMATKKELAQILALLGRSRIANNLNQIAHAANIGIIEVTPDVLAQIDEAYRAMLWMRRTLITELGIKGE